MCFCYITKNLKSQTYWLSPELNQIQQSFSLKQQTSWSSGISAFIVSAVITGKHVLILFPCCTVVCAREVFLYFRGNTAVLLSVWCSVFCSKKQFCWVDCCILFFSFSRKTINAALKRAAPARKIYMWCRPVSLSSCWTADINELLLVYWRQRWCVPPSNAIRRQWREIESLSSAKSKLAHLVQAHVSIPP